MRQRRRTGCQSLGELGLAIVRKYPANESDSGAMSVDMVPMLIQQGFRAIAVQFDVWGLSKLIHGSLTQARAAAKQVGTEANGESETNGAKA